MSQTRPYRIYWTEIKRAVMLRCSIHTELADLKDVPKMEKLHKRVRVNVCVVDSWKWYMSFPFVSYILNLIKYS